MKIQKSLYTLTKKNKVNSKDSGSTQFGALIKVFEGSHWGVADLCPWPLLGDLNLTEELGGQGPLFQRACQLAQEDLRARIEKRSLLRSSWVENNILVTDYRHFNWEDPSWLGRTLKIKGDADVDALAALMNRLPNSIRVRLDFNGILSPDEFQKFLDQIHRRSPIDYIEDPTRYDSGRWAQWNRIIPLACDFVLATDHFQTKIVKPAREKIPNFGKFTLTSSMDHPVGVAHALRYAQDFAQNISGLATLGLYEETNFHSAFETKDICWLNYSPEALSEADANGGIGMNQRLNQLVWTEL